MTRDFIADMLREAYHYASFSPDRSTRNGAVLVAGVGGAAPRVIGRGCNRIVPDACARPERLERPAKYAWTEHAERDALFNAVLRGAGGKVPRATLLGPWAASPDCARAMVGMGVARMVRHQHPGHGRRSDWAESLAVADEMLAAAGIEVVDFVGHLGVTVVFGGAELVV
jgi:dCMP deaminase